ncbi:MAG: S1 family peptidase [Deltaproteobacteria bacterium]
MKRALPLLAALALLLSPGTGFTLDGHRLKNEPLTTFIGQLKRTSVLILATDSKTVSGTGFLTLNQKNQVLVVTNKHVIAKGRPLFVRVNTQEKVLDYRADVLRESDSYDVCILGLEKERADQEWVASDLIIPLDLYGSQNDIVEGREVVYIGYPLGLGVEEKNYPISRTGLIAQAVPGRKTYLVDGFANHGNSGSPVFSRTEGKLIGIVSSFEPDFIDSYEEGRMITRIPFNSGISRVISVEAIRDLIQGK